MLILSDKKTLVDKLPVSAQGTMAREYVSTQGTLAREHVSTQGTLARKHARHVGM